MEYTTARRHSTVLNICMVATLGLAMTVKPQPAHAQGSAQETAGSHSVQLPEDKFVPPADQFDWIQLTSGEWLKGTLESLYNRKLVFDSDELDNLSFDWEDVKRVRCHGLQSIRLQPSDPDAAPFTVIGNLEIVGDKVVVTSDGGAQEFARSSLVSIAEGSAEEIDYWSVKVSLGANLRRGNSDLLEYTGAANVRRRDADSRVLVDYLGNYSEAEGTQTANNQRLSAAYDLFKTRRHFWRVVGAEYFSDPFQNFRHRLTVGTALGYHIVDTAKTEWDITAGLAYQYSEFVSVEAGRSNTNDTPALSVGTTYNHDLRHWIELIVGYDFLVVNEDAGTYTHHFVTTVSTDLIGDLDFDVSLVWDRIQDPQAKSDGTVPERDDYRLILSLSYDF